MPVRGTVRLLRELDPVATLAPPPAPRRPAPRRTGGFVAAAALALIVAVASSGGTGSSPGLAEAAHAALTAPDRIVHLQLRSRFHAPADAPSSTEVWMHDGGRQLRVLYDGGQHEFVRDEDRRYAASYVRHRHEITVFTDPAVVEARAPDELTFGGPEAAARVAEQLSDLLARARQADPAVRRLPDAELDGRAAGRLEATAMVPYARGAAEGGEGPPHLEAMPIRTVIWLDLDTHLPRRIERFGPTGQRESTTDVLVAQRLELDARTRRLLQMTPHRGAARRTAHAR